MAVVRVPELDQTIDDTGAIREFLAERGIDYWQAAPDAPVAAEGYGARAGRALVEG